MAAVRAEGNQTTELRLIAIFRAHGITGWRRRLRQQLEQTIQKIDALRIWLNPVSMPEYVFDPTAPKIVGKLVADTLLLQPRKPLHEVIEKRFYGAGVYALYYHGDFDCYRPIAGHNHPIFCQDGGREHISCRLFGRPAALLTRSEAAGGIFPRSRLAGQPNICP